MKPYKASILFTDDGMLNLRITKFPDSQLGTGIVIATVPGTPKDLPQWMIEAYKAINHQHPITLLEAQLIASIKKVNHDKYQ